MDIQSRATSLTTIANKIVEVNTRNNNVVLVKAQKEYKKLGDFLNIQTPELERFPLPNNKEIEKPANLKIVNKSTSTTKSSGVGLGGSARGVLSDKGKKVYSTPQMSKVAIKPSMKGGKFMSPGIRNLGGVASTLFAGLDFTTGIAGGESVGKSAVGTTGALAGSLVGGAIGQALIPIPGVGYIVGSAAGNFIGGYGADRAYEAIASQSRLKAKQDAKLKAQRQVRNKGTKVENKDKILNKFDEVANKFEGFVKGLVGGVKDGIFGYQREDPYGPNNKTPENDTPPPNITKPDGKQNYIDGGKIVQYYHGEKGREGYRADHWNHDHFSFNSREAAVVAFKALQAAGYEPYEFEGYGPVRLHSDTGGHYGPVGGPKTAKEDDGTAFDIPYSTYGTGDIGPKDYEKSRRAHEIVLQALSKAESSKPKPKPKTYATPNAKKSQVKTYKSNLQTDVIKLVEKYKPKGVNDLINKVFNAPKSNKGGNTIIKPKDNKSLGSDMLKFGSNNTDTLKEKVQDFNQMNWQSQITTPKIETKKISHKLSYKETQRDITVLNSHSIHILDSGGNTPRIAAQSPSQNEGSSASPSSPPTSNSSRQHPSDILNTYIGSIRLA